MGEMDSYKQNCDYIRKKFDLPEIASIYTIVNKITEAYKDVEDKKELDKVIVETTLKQEKKRGRPRKSDSN